MVGVRAPDDQQLGYVLLVGHRSLAEGERVGRLEGHAAEPAGRRDVGRAEDRGEALGEGELQPVRLAQAEHHILRPGLFLDRTELVGDGIQRFVPGDALPLTLAPGAHPLEGIEEPVGMAVDLGDRETPLLVDALLVGEAALQVGGHIDDDVIGDRHLDGAVSAAKVAEGEVFLAGTEGRDPHAGLHSQMVDERFLHGMELGCRRTCPRR